MLFFHDFMRCRAIAFRCLRYFLIFFDVFFSCFAAAAADAIAAADLISSFDDFRYADY